VAVDGAHSVRGEGRGTPLHPGGAVSSQLLGAVRSTGRARLQRPLAERRVGPSQETLRLRLFLEGNSAGSCRGAGGRSFDCGGAEKLLRPGGSWSFSDQQKRWMGRREKGSSFSSRIRAIG
jgi:hypothetical protein